MKLFKSLRKDVFIRDILHKEMAGLEAPRPHGTIHASDLLKEKEFCPREWAFLDLDLVKKKSEYISVAMRATFDHGRDLEWRLRNVWLRNHMVGLWSCPVCGNKTEEISPVPEVKCNGCGALGKWEYEEVRLTDPVTKVSGGIDGLVRVGPGKLKLLEIKTMDKLMHQKLVAPLAEHKARTALYLHLVSVSTHTKIDSNKGNILYVSKSHGFKEELETSTIITPFKEFIVSRDISLVEDKMNRAKALTYWREHGKSGFPCGVCPNGFSKRAQQCVAVGLCWGGSFPGTITWKEQGVTRHPGKPVEV